MMMKVRKAHPSVIINGVRKPYPVCKTKTGYNCRNKKKRLTDLKDLGPGVTIYFKFVKYLVVTFFTLSLITLPAIILHVSGGTEEYSKSKNINSFFGMTTLGNLGSSYRMCGSGDSFSSTISLF